MDNRCVKRRHRDRVALIVMAIYAGLTCPIVNPLHEEVATAILAADLAMGHDEWGARWIRAYRQRRKAAG